MVELHRYPMSVRHVIESARAPEGDEWKQRYLIPYSHIISAASGLIESRQFMLRVPFRRSSWGPHIDEDFASAISETGAIRWRGRENTELFALDFFLNKAQSDTAAATDSVINGWILALVPETIEQTQFSNSIIGLFVGDRSQLLNTLHDTRIQAACALFEEIERLVPQEIIHILDPLRQSALAEFEVPWRSFSEYNNTVRAQQEIHYWAGRFIKSISGPLRNPREVDREGILGLLLDQIQLSLDICAAITLSRVNAYKHLTYGVSDRYDFVYPVEWVVAAKALRWIGDLFRIMIRRLLPQPEQEGNQQ